MRVEWIELLEQTPSATEEDGTPRVSVDGARAA